MLPYYQKECQVNKGVKRFMKKVISALITGIMMSGNVVFAISETNENNTLKDKVRIEQNNKVYKYQTKKSRRFDDGYKYEYINMDWWKSFNDTNLEDYIIKAVQHNHDLKKASIAVDEYYQYTKLQFASELPSVTTGFSPAWLKNAGKSNYDWTYMAPVLINYEADIFLKNHDKTKSVKKDYEASLEDERAAYIAMASAVAVTYFNIVRLDELIECQEQIVDLRGKIFDLMKKSNQEGIVSVSDTVKANKAYVYGKSELPELKKTRTKLLNQLSVLIGETPDNVEGMPRTALKDIRFPQNLPEEISSEIIVNRPDYIKAEKMLEKAGIDVRAAKKEFLPSINLSGLALFSNSHMSEFFNTASSIYALAGAGLVPLYTGGKRLAALRLKRASYDRVLEDYLKVNKTAVQEVNDALVVLKQDTAKLKQNEEHEKLEEKDFNYSKNRYKNGVISKRELYEMNENLLSVHKLVLSDKAACYIDSIGLYKAVSAKL